MNKEKSWNWAYLLLMLVLIGELVFFQWISKAYL